MKQKLAKLPGFPRTVVTARRVNAFFCVHRGPNESPRYIVTHMRSGYRAGSAYDQKTAIKVARALLKACGPDVWHFTRPNNAAMLAIGPTAREAIKNVGGICP